MPSQNFYNANLAANSRTNVLADWLYETLPWPALAEVGIIHDGAANAVLATVMSGSDVLMDDGAVRGGGTDGVFPTDEQLDLSDEAAADDKLTIRLRENLAIATTDVMTRVKLTPLM